MNFQENGSIIQEHKHNQKDIHGYWILCTKKNLKYREYSIEVYTEVVIVPETARMTEILEIIAFSYLPKGY